MHVAGVGVVVCLRLGRYEASVSRVGIFERHRNHGFTEWGWIGAAVLRGDRPSFYVRGPVRRAALRIWRERFAPKPLLRLVS